MDNDQEKEEELFYSYTPEKEDITLYIILVKYFTDNKKEKNISLNKYSDDYCSLYNKRHYNSYHTFKKNETLYDIQKRISSYVGFPIEVMDEFGYDGGERFDSESNKLYDIAETYKRPTYYKNRRTLNYSEIKIKGSIYDSDIIRKRWVYIYINIDKDKCVKYLNDAILKKDKEVNEVNNK